MVYREWHLLDNLGERPYQSKQTPDNNKKKGKAKNKKPGNQQENPKPTINEHDKGRRKEQYPYLLCRGDHFTKECPRRE